VPGALEQRPLGQDGAVDGLAAAADGLLGSQALQFGPDHRAIGQPQREPCADQRVGGEQLQFTAEPPVIGGFPVGGMIGSRAGSRVSSRVGGGVRGGWGGGGMVSG
jgi:hypothetical protein